MTTTGVTPARQAETEETQYFRSHMGRVSRQSSVFLVGTLFSAAAAYLFKVYLARVLGAESLGIYTLGMTLVGLVTVFSTLGLPRAALRFVSAYSATGKGDQLWFFLVRAIRTILICNVVLAFVMYFCAPWVALRFYHVPQLKAYVTLFVFITLLGVLNAFLGQTLGGYKDVSRRTIINNFIGSPLMMVVTILFIVLGFGLRGYILAQVCSGVLVLALYAFSVWKLTPKPAAPLWKVPPFEREVVSFSVTALALALVDFFIIQGDRIMIGHYLDVREVGIYSVAWAVTAYLSIILNSVNQIFAPTISDLHARGQKELLGRMFQTLTKWILGLSVPLAAVIIIFARPLMRVFGHDFEAGWPILVIGAIGQLVNCAVGSAGTILLMSGKQKNLMWVMSSSAVIMIVLNWWFIPRWGILGAAVVSAITIVVTNIANLSRVRHTLGLSPYNKSYWRLVLPFIGCLTVLLLARLEKGLFHPEWLVIILGLIFSYLAFVGIALAVGLDEDDRIIARAVWGRISSAMPGAEVNQ